VFRIGHLGHFNDAALIGTLGSIEVGLVRAGVPIRDGGVDAALGYLRANRAGDSGNNCAPNTGPVIPYSGPPEDDPDG
jgi:hypothetical protein